MFISTSIVWCVANEKVEAELHIFYTHNIERRHITNRCGALHKQQVEQKVEYHLSINNKPAVYSFLVGVLAGLFERHRIKLSDTEKAYELLEVLGDEMAQLKQPRCTDSHGSPQAADNRVRCTVLNYPLLVLHIPDNICYSTKWIELGTKPIGGTQCTRLLYLPYSLGSCSHTTCRQARHLQSTSLTQPSL